MGKHDVCVDKTKFHIKSGVCIIKQYSTGLDLSPSVDTVRLTREELEQGLRALDSAIEERKN